MIEKHINIWNYIRLTRIWVGIYNGRFRPINRRAYKYKKDKTFYYQFVRLWSSSTLDKGYICYMWPRINIRPLLSYQTHGLTYVILDPKNGLHPSRPWSTFQVSLTSFFLKFLIVWPLRSTSQGPNCPTLAKHFDGMHVIDWQCDRLIDRVTD